MAESPARVSDHQKKAPDTSSGKGPRLVSPQPDAVVDAHSITFEWDALDDARYTLELARERSFSDTVASIPTGTSTSATVYDLFRPSDERFYWRVVANRPGKSPDVSTPAAFTAVGYEQAIAAEAAARDAEKGRAAAAQRERNRAGDEAAPLVDVAVPYLEQATTNRETSIVVFVMVVSFVITLAVLFYLSIQLQ